MALPLAGFAATTAGSKLLLNTGLALATGILSEKQAEEAGKPQSLQEQIINIGTATIAGTLGTTIVGPEASLAKQIAGSSAANILAEKALNIKSPAASALEQLGEVATNMPSITPATEPLPPLPSGYPYNSALFLEYYNKAIEAAKSA